MKYVSILSFLACVLLEGCAPANITSAKWDSAISGSNAQTRCERVDMRNRSEMDVIFPKYDGWKLVYISEYTTPNLLGTDAAVCFERTK